MKLEDVKIEDFLIKNRLPYENRKFFCQHLAPYVFLKHLLKKRIKNILEIGIGEGFGLYFLSDIAENTVGLDIDIKCYDYLKEYKKKLSNNNLFFINGQATKLPFKDNSFWAVITCQVIEHIPPPNLKDFLGEIRRVVIPEGIVVISTLNLSHNIKDPSRYTKFEQHYKEFDYYAFKDLISEVFNNFNILGLDITLRHRFFQRLKKWGLMNIKPVINFYNTINTSDFKISKVNFKKTLDLIAVCYK